MMGAWAPDAIRSLFRQAGAELADSDVSARKLPEADDCSLRVSKDGESSHLNRGNFLVNCGAELLGASHRCFEVFDGQGIHMTGIDSASGGSVNIPQTARSPDLNML